jgi:starch phosphorylase
MRKSMAELTPRFSSNRMLREYVDRLYLPAAAAHHERTAEKGAVGRQVVNWRHALEQKWTGLRFGEIKVETDGGQHVFEAQVHLNDLDPNSVIVELYADGVKADGPERHEMTRARKRLGKTGAFLYSARVPAVRPTMDYTARVIPHRTGVEVPLEANYILWQR